ncbi:hypothetical protein [Legionella jordanis]|uniref:Uncharacterized protein n=1 Tax=Legionella jordanis TaxID=456 RepID=A0A0W0V8P1_9GAMM|nr:hypothetical protein [Legionella jordanis]KTD16440.1 hypothetical protein Ljor_0746 [Legionella jordanis]VEH12100.1 Uncharacterised protein [Legionella jordanis]
MKKSSKHSEEKSMKEIHGKDLKNVVGGKRQKTSGDDGYGFAIRADKDKTTDKRSGK